MQEPLIVPESLIIPSKPKVADLIAHNAIGRNMCVESLPAVVLVHFAELKPQRKTIRIKNTQSSSTRVTIHPLREAEFSIQYRKKGLLAPGMAEELTLIFRPTEWKYYSDSIKVSTEDGSGIVVPIHCLPGEALAFPRMIDFGNVERGISSLQKIPINHTLPFTFNYRAQMLSSCSAFKVDPSEGISGDNALTVTFNPIEFGTYFSEILVEVPHLGIQKKIKIMGGCFDKKIIHENFHENDNIHKKSEKKIKIKKIPKPSVAKRKTSPECELSNGVLIPGKIKGRTSTEFILKQRPGHLPHSEFVAAVRAGRARGEGKEQSEEQETMIEDQGVFNEIGSRITSKFPDFKEVCFLEFFNKVEKAEILKATKIQRYAGESLPTDARINEILKKREHEEKKIRDRIMKEAMNRKVAESCKIPVTSGKTTLMTLSEGIPMGPSFKVRAEIIERFARIAELVIVRWRADKRIQRLKRSRTTN